MARRKSGREIHGWVIIDKPAGISSNQVVGKVRWAFNARKAGHAGTLDPEATGLLAVALGEATKTVPYLMEALKAYRFTVRLGAATNTDDSEGETIATSDHRPGDDEIHAALPELTGDIMQVPPKFSAVKVDGARAYALARDGDDPELAARPLYVDRLDLVARPDRDHAELEMVCGKGGYVRAIARDLGQMLGCYGHVAKLNRLWSGPFGLEDSIRLDEIEADARQPVLDTRLLPLETALEELPELPCSEGEAARLRNGNPVELRVSELDYGTEAWASLDGQAIAVGRVMAGRLHPSRVFLHNRAQAASDRALGAPRG